MVRGFCAALVAALVFPAAAAAHTDFGPQLAFDWPAQGTVTSPFGRDGYRWHPGLDIGSLRSLDIRAASAGVVAKTGYITVARVGQQVLPGQLLGIAGCTGWCTGTHLHFELRYRGHPMDPAPLMTAQVLG
jgi:murein DD-endopeptidase MepM/ murein hydrolase activator NlpD